MWVFIYAAFCCIFQSQQSETVRGRNVAGGGATPSHFIWRNERQNLPQKYAKFAAFTEFMVICVALLMLLNLHLTNGIQLPPQTLSSSLHTAPQRTPFRRWNKRSACARFACPFYLSLSVCLSSLFGHLSKHFQLHFVYCNFNMRFWWYRFGEIGKPNQQWCSSWSAPARKCKQRVRITETIRMQLQLPLLFRLQLQSAVSWQADRLAKLNTPSNPKCVLGLQITYRVGERGGEI